MAGSGKKKRKLIIWLLFLLPVLYLGIQILRGTQNNYETQLALSVTVRDSITTEGIVVRNESRLDQSIEGVADFTVSDTERVSAGYEVAKVFANEAAAQSFSQMQQTANRIAILQQAQQDALNAGTDVSLIQRQLKGDVNDYISMLQSGSYTGVDQIRDAIDYSFNKMDIAVGDETGFETLVASLEEKKAALEAQGVAIGSIYTPISGYFCYTADGLEELDPTQISVYSAGQLQSLLEQKEQMMTLSAFGKVVSANEWYYFCVLSREQTERLTVRQKVTLDFPEAGLEDLPAKISYIGEPDENGDSVVSVRCDRVSPAISSLRFEKVEITLASYTGARIPRSALHVTENGEYGVYVKYGTIIKYCYVKPLFEQGQFLIVALDIEVKKIDKDSLDERSGLRMYDEIIISGRDLYKGKLL